MSVGSLEEIIDDNHAIVSTSVGSEHYVSIMSFVDKDQLEPGCSVLLNHKVSSNICMFAIILIVIRLYWLTLFYQFECISKMLLCNCNLSLDLFESWCYRRCSAAHIDTEEV